MLDFNLVKDDCEVNFAEVKAYSLSCLESILQRFQPGGKVVRGEYACGGIYGGSGDSCSTNLSTGVGSDFATGQAWGDPIDLVSQIEDCSMTEAARLIQGGHSVSGYKLTPQKSPDEKYREGKDNAIALWLESVACPHDHPYLVKKQVFASNDIRLHPPTGNILIPLKDGKGEFWSVQRISPDGTKKVSHGGKMAGNFFTFPGETDTVYICEGYSTAATVAACTGKTAIMTVSSGNLRAVSETACKLYPTAEIVFAADNDNVTPPPNQVKNPGLTAATNAKKYIGRGRIALPPTPDETKCDWNDYFIEHGMEATRMLLLSTGRHGLRIDKWGMEAYAGAAKPVEWIVENILPRGKVGLLVAAGDTGKGMLTLSLALQVAAGPVAGLDLNDGSGWFGNPIVGHGKVVIFSAEDDFDELHRRISAMDPDGRLREQVKNNLRVIPLPNAGGPFPLVTMGKNGVQASEQYYNILDQLKEIDDLALINFDPLASFVTADINSDPAVGAFTTGLLASMAIETRASIMVAHHMSKMVGKDGSVHTAAQARTAIRGTTAIVDGSRVSLAIWPVDERKAKTICDGLGVEYTPNRIFDGAVVKSNGAADREVKTFVRDDNGLLVVRNSDIQKTRLTEKEIDEFLFEDISVQTADNKPFFDGGGDCMDKRRANLNPGINALSKKELDAAVQRLCISKRIIRAKTGGKFCWDVPGGAFAEGHGFVDSGGR